VDWVVAQDAARCFISSMTLGEIQKGISKLADSTRKADLRSWLARDVQEQFSGRIIAVSVLEALQWGDMQASAESSGKPMPVVDSLIAATALLHGMTLVTRNTRDMEASGVKLFNPWG
jgi:predicted nucleic acid-binding protein